MAVLRRYVIFAVFAVSFLYLALKLHSYPFPQRPGSQHSSAPEENGKLDVIRVVWGTLKPNNPLKGFKSLPSGEPIAFPKIQHDFAADGTPEKIVVDLRETRRTEVKKEFVRCWQAYKERAWLKDELKPLSGLGDDRFGGWAATLIDSLDVLWIMDLKDEFKEAVAALDRVDFEYCRLREVNVFETTIRHLGGLLSAYDLSGERKLILKAIELGDMLLTAFDTPNRMPLTRWDCQKSGRGEAQIAPEHALIAEIGSLSMEFTHLSQITKNPKWYDAIARITDALASQQNKTNLPGMWPIFVNLEKADFTGGFAKEFIGDKEFTLGGRSDSIYEYLPKTWALLGGLEPVYRQMFETAAKTITEKLLFRPMVPDNSDILMSGTVTVQDGNTILDPVFEHLTCFTGGMFAVAGKLMSNEEHVNIGRKLTNACIWSYQSMPLGIMPEIAHFLPCKSATECAWDEVQYKAEVDRKANASNEKDPLRNIAQNRIPQGFTGIDDRRYILRPEAIESVFMLYRITGEQSFQAAAWNMFTAIQKYTRTDLANAALFDISITEGLPEKMDSMESFWLAETLKYFYLVFSDPSVISLDDYVFNTEAHPFKIPKPKSKAARI